MNKLERCGLEILEKMEFECFGDLGQVRIAEAFPQAAVSPDDHFEFDYFILCGNKCLIGEMSGIGNEDKIKRRFRKFAHHFQFLHTANDTSFFKCFNISRQQLHKFDEVASFQAFFYSS